MNGTIQWGTMILWLPKGICFRLILHLKRKAF
jgi:hypothetical protein